MNLTSKNSFSSSRTGKAKTATTLGMLRQFLWLMIMIIFGGQLQQICNKLTRPSARKKIYPQINFFTINNRWDNVPKSKKRNLKGSTIRRIVAEEYNKLDFPPRLKLLQQNLKKIHIHIH